MLIYLLIAAIALTTFFIDSPKKSALLVFILPAIAFQFSSSMIKDNYFHLSACSLDLAVIILLVIQRRINSMVLFVGLISGFSILSNIFGWMMYEKGFSSSAYDGVFTAIYALVLLVSLMEWWSCARTNRNHSRFRGDWV